MRVYLVLSCLALAFVVVYSNRCGGHDHDDPTPCIGVASCDDTSVLGCQEDMCTCLPTKQSCHNATDCSGFCQQLYGHDWDHDNHEHCLDGFCDCFEIKH